MTAPSPVLNKVQRPDTEVSNKAVELQKVSLSYALPGGGLKTVLDEIDLTMNDGEFVCVLGETGCGKSTLLRLVLGEQKPSSGKLLVAGRPIDRIGPMCGYVPQRYSLFPDRTVLDNVTFGPECTSYNLFTRFTPAFFAARRVWRDKGSQHLLRMGLQAGDFRKYPHELSGGMQQRVAIAQALMLEPPILLMDEAFSALDPATRLGMQSQLRAIWTERRTTIMFVTHNTAEALTIATRVIVLAKGEKAIPGKDGARIALDWAIPSSKEPMAERRHGKEFLEMIEYVEAHSTASDKKLMRTSVPDGGSR